LEDAKAVFPLLHRYDDGMECSHKRIIVAVGGRIDGWWKGRNPTAE